MTSNPKRVLLLMSDTGGGHRAAAEAISAALSQQYGDQVTCTIVDVFRSYAPAPLKFAPELYPIWIKRGKFLWSMNYHLSDHRANANLLMRTLWLAMRRGLKRLFNEHTADVIVSVHPLFNSPSMYVLRRMADRPPFITVVTDLVTTHFFWYSRRVERIIVPTEAAYERGIKFGVAPDHLRVLGLPVHPRFAAGLLSKAEAREKLKWDATLPTVLLIGGGDGMGPLARIAKRLNKLGADYQLVIVAGRNEKLKASLDAVAWNQPTHVYGFVTNMPEFMAAADILVTKAGPGTIVEACMAGLPIIISDHIPGQEYGNIKFVIENNAGAYARGPRRVALVVKKWLDAGESFLKARAINARQLARPDAANDIAAEIWDLANQPRIEQPPATSTRGRRIRPVDSQNKSNRRPPLKPEPPK